MQILTMNTSRLILTGDPLFVAAMARRFEATAVDYSIVMSTGMMGPNGEDPFSFDFETEQIPLPVELLPFQRRVVALNKISSNSFEVIVEASLGGSIEKAQALLPFVEQNPNVIVLTSTLTCTATEVGGFIPTIERSVFGFNPLPFLTSMTSMEVAPGLCAQDNYHSREIVDSFIRQIGFAPEFVEDRLALVFPRIISMLINEAAFAVMEGVTSAEGVDTALKLGVNYPKGVLEWADEIGLESIISILDSLYNEYHQERYRTCVLLRQYMRAGWTGKRSGRGFTVGQS